MTTTRRTRATRATDAPKAEDATARLVRLAAERGGRVLGVAMPPPAVLGKAKRSKYRNVLTVYEGATYSSKAEAAYAVILDREKAVGRIRGWTRQVPFYLGCHENKYVTDFLVLNATGESFAIDVKGVETAKFRRDKKLWRRFGLMPLRIVTKGRVVETIIPECMETENEADGN